jgi:hypothetical protein
LFDQYIMSVPLHAGVEQHQAIVQRLEPVRRDVDGMRVDRSIAGKGKSGQSTQGAGVLILGADAFLDHLLLDIDRFRRQLRRRDRLSFERVQRMQQPNGGGRR